MLTYIDCYLEVPSSRVARLALLRWRKIGVEREYDLDRLDRRQWGRRVNKLFCHQHEQ